MKKKLILPLVLSSAALIMASCGTASSPADSSVAPASSEPSSSESEPAPLPEYAVADAAGTPDSFADIKGVEGGKSAAVSLVGESVETKTEILGTLEKYAIDNYVTGLPLFENGGYVMYDNRVVKGTENYITGYGFGIIREGNLNGSLKAKDLPKPDYYHSYEPSDPQSINYLDDQGSQVGDLYGNCAAGYFGTKMAQDKTSYDWYGTLSSKDRPVKLKLNAAKDGLEIDDTAEGTSKYWRVYVRTGEKGGVAFRTNSAKADRKAFDKKWVTIDDYINAFKILLCGKFAYYRGAELAGQTGYSAIAGAQAYYNASEKAGFGAADSEAAWNNVGIKAGHDNDGDYIDFTLGAATSRFYAMYSLASNLYAPINLDFFKLVTNNYANPEFYGAFNTDKSASPVDNFLSTGPYFLESWETDKHIAFARNDDWWEKKADPQVYRIPGIYQAVLTAVNTDSNAAFKEFILSGTLDSASIPTDFLASYKNDPRSTKVPGDSVFKLNLNTTTPEKWAELFGKDGTITRTKESDYWNVKPWMSNDNFVQGLFYAIDRDTFATKNGSIPSINYFSSNYMSDPENGVSYNTTDAHANALSDFWGDTIRTYGYSKEAAQVSFTHAIEELVADKKVKDGDILEIDVWWMYQQHITRYHNDIAKFIQDAFNESQGAKDHLLALKVNGYAVDVWSDVYYKHLMTGQFDLGFGSISGNALDPLNFMEVLKSDNSSGFTLNWGPDTSKIDLEYKGEKWSFDNLWAAADHGVLTYKGQQLPPIVVSFGKAEFDAKGDLILTFSYETALHYMMSKKDSDPEAKKLIDAWESEAEDALAFDTYLDYAYITDGVSVELAINPDGTLEGAEGYAEVRDFKTDKLFGDDSGYYSGTITIALSQDLLLVFANEEEEGAFYYGAYGIAEVDGNESRGDAYSAVAFSAKPSNN
ncbi:MAG: ABC transporter substrate-binding protein [Bacilli bacterium]|nr:ABC transporter substrate-binding protein [Bacilli bacterium]